MGIENTLWSLNCNNFSFFHTVQEKKKEEENDFRFYSAFAHRKVLVFTQRCLWVPKVP